MAFIELKDVKKIYRMGEVEVRAADGIDFEIQKGEFVVVVGPSGAGKTTVLNILGGMDTATSGSVILTVELDIMMFGRIIRPRSYIYSILLTFLFAIIVAFAMHYRLKKIDMVESLKSVE